MTAFRPDELGSTGEKIWDYRLGGNPDSLLLELLSEAKYRDALLVLLIEELRGRIDTRVDTHGLREDPQ